MFSFTGGSYFFILYKAPAVPGSMQDVAVSAVDVDLFVCSEFSALLFYVPGYSTMSPQEDSENPPCNNDPLSAGVDVGNHDEDLDLDTPPQTAALLSHKFHHYRLHHPTLHHSHHLQAAVTVHTVDAEC